MSDFSRHLVFIHIPKTAGTFIREGLEQHYEKIGCAYGTKPFANFSTMDGDQLAAFKTHEVLIGHESFHAFQTHLDRPATYFTVLRNPVDRLISYYNHLMTHAPNFANHKVTLLKFLENRSNYEIDNVQLRYLSGKPVKHPVGQAELDHAKSLIDNGVLHAGIKERLAETLERLPIFQGVKFDVSAPSNKSVFGFSRNSLTQTELDAIRARCFWDIKLYQHALSAFEQKGWTSAAVTQTVVHEQ